MRSILILAACLCSLLPAQRAFQPLRVTVSEDGIYRLSYAQIAEHTNARGARPDRMTLLRDGVQVPIAIRGGRDGRLDPGDSIVFYGQSQQGPHTQAGTYILTTQRNPRRIRKMPRVPAGSEARDTARRILTFEEDRVFAPLACVQPEVIRSGKPRDHWFWSEVYAPSGAAPGPETNTTCVANITPEPRRSSGATLTLHCMGPPVPGIKQKLVVNINGRDLEPVEWDTPLEKTIRLRVPVGVVELKNSIQIKNASSVPVYAEPGNEVGRRRNRVLIDRLTLEIDSLLMGPAAPEEQLHYVLDPAWLKDGRPLDFTPLRSEGLLVYDVGRHTWANTGRVPVPSNPQQPVEFVCSNLEGLKTPEVAPLRKTRAHLAGPGADWVVVTSSRLAPLLTPLTEHRRARGLTPMVIEAQELYDTFTHGSFDPKAIGAIVRAAHRNWKTKPRYVLLFGDADHGADWISQYETIPTQMVMTDYNGATATDALFGDVDGDGSPDIPVGRLPVRTGDEALRVINRVIDLENRPPSGTWRRRIRFVAGEARFNPAVDRLLERTFRNVVGKEIPAAFRLSMTWSNPRSDFYWPASRFSERVVSEFNDGSLVFTYVGHGSAQAFDSIRDRSGLLHPILDARSVESIDAKGRNPVLAIIACWTGMFDEPSRDCIAELLLRKDGGPAAIIASSRISHPFPDALLGMGLARGFFKGRRTLGDVLQEARATMLAESSGAIAKLSKPFLSKAIDADALIKDHIYLYNLLGDPATVVPFPDKDLTVSASGPARAGGPLKVNVACGDGGGHLLVSLERPIQRKAEGMEKPAAGEDKGSGNELLAVRNHSRANNPILARTELNVQGGDVTVVIDIPADLPPGPHNVTAYLVGADGSTDGLGATSIRIEPKEQ